MKMKLIKHSTDDGLSFVKDEIPLGTIYEVDETMIKTLSWGNVETKEVTKRPSIFVTSGGGGWMPLELFSAENSEVN